MTPDTDLATLRDYCEGRQPCEAIIDRLETELARLREELDEAQGQSAIWQDSSGAYCERMVTAERELARLREGLSRWFGPDGTLHPPLDILNQRALREVDDALRALLANTPLGGDPVEVRPSQSRAERQTELNGPSGSPTSPPKRDTPEDGAA